MTKATITKVRNAMLNSKRQRYTSTSQATEAAARALIKKGEALMVREDRVWGPQNTPRSRYYAVEIKPAI